MGHKRLHKIGSCFSRVATAAASGAWFWGNNSIYMELVWGLVIENISKRVKNASSLEYSGVYCP
jgi:hypothetical protein